MEVGLQSAPATGIAQPGNLYADMQSRQLWLGVSTVSDPTGSVLISDILALQAADTTTLNNAKAYTDSQISTRAPTVHTHTSTQISDFNSAVTGVVTGIPQLQYIRGMILLWYGAVVSIGVGNLAGWALCDGTTYTIDGTPVKTPDLRDRFVIGAGAGRAVNSLNSISSIKTDAQGSHAHAISSTTLSLAQLPAHAHTSGTLAGTIAGTTNTDSHAHTYTVAPLRTVGVEGGGYYTGGWVGGSTSATTSSDAHNHTVSGSCDVSSGSTANAGGGTSHTHTASSDGVHDHTITSNQVRDVIASIALCYIMKL